VVVGAAALLEQLAEGIVIVGIGDLADGIAQGPCAAQAIVEIVGGVGSVVFRERLRIVVIAVDKALLGDLSLSDGEHW